MSQPEKPAWYGGNKIPLSYLKKFMPNGGKDYVEPVEVPRQISLFLEGL